VISFEISSVVFSLTSPLLPLLAIYSMIIFPLFYFKALFADISNTTFFPNLETALFDVLQDLLTAFHIFDIMFLIAIILCFLGHNTLKSCHSEIQC
jgi:hypothetical protein